MDLQTGVKTSGCPGNERGGMTMKKFGENEVKEKLEPVGKGIEKVSHAVGEVAKETVGKAAAAVAAGGEKASEMKEKVAVAAEETGKKAMSVKRKTAAALSGTGRKAEAVRKKVAAEIVPEIYVQWAGRECLCADVLERAKADFHANNKGVIHSCKIYIKPEDSMAYYVINGKEGKVIL